MVRRVAAVDSFASVGLRARAAPLENPYSLAADLEGLDWAPGEDDDDVARSLYHMED